MLTKQLDDHTYVVTDPRYTTQTTPQHIQGTAEAVPGWVALLLPLGILFLLGALSAKPQPSTSDPSSPTIGPKAPHRR